MKSNKKWLLRFSDWTDSPKHSVPTITVLAALILWLAWTAFRGLLWLGPLLALVGYIIVVIEFFRKKNQ